MPVFLCSCSSRCSRFMVLNGVSAVIPCSCRSRCSRFMKFKRSVRCIFNREMRESRESLYGLFLLVRTLRVVRDSLNSKGVSVVIKLASLLNSRARHRACCSPEISGASSKNRPQRQEPLQHGVGGWSSDDGDSIIWLAANSPALMNNSSGIVS